LQNPQGPKSEAIVRGAPVGQLTGHAKGMRRDFPRICPGLDFPVVFESIESVGQHVLTMCSCRITATHMLFGFSFRPSHSERSWLSLVHLNGMRVDLCHPGNQGEQVLATNFEPPAVSSHPHSTAPASRHERHLANIFFLGGKTCVGHERDSRQKAREF
jgi:hypothetical protein